MHDSRLLGCGKIGQEKQERSHLLTLDRLWQETMDQLWKKKCSNIICWNTANILKPLKHNKHNLVFLTIYLQPHIHTYTSWCRLPYGYRISWIIKSLILAPMPCKQPTFSTGHESVPFSFYHFPRYLIKWCWKLNSVCKILTLNS